MPQASQWTNRPPGASGSSRISASERLPGGGAVPASGGERSAPSQVCRRGIVAPTAKALLVSDHSATANLLPPTDPPVVASTGHGDQADHRALGLVPDRDHLRRRQQLHLAAVPPEVCGRFLRQPDPALLPGTDQPPLRPLLVEG